MTVYKIARIIAFGSFLFLSCEKENENGTVVVGVKLDGKYMNNPTVYMKKGTLTRPTGSFTWDKIQAGGADGKATFENLSPGDYYFYAREYGSSSYRCGEVGTTVLSRSRQNWYEPTINLK